MNSSVSAEMKLKLAHRMKELRLRGAHIHKMPPELVTNFVRKNWILLTRDLPNGNIQIEFWTPPAK